MWLNLTNCMFNVLTQETVPHSPHYNSRAQLPVKYNPDATCSKWTETIAEIFLDDLAKCDVLQEFFGYCLFPKIIFPCALFQIGGGANGKGTIQAILVKMLGEANVSHISLTRMEERFGPKELKDKLLNTCGETSTKPLEVSRFKEICAADTVQAEVKHGRDVIFIPIAKHLISMNEFPGIKDKTYAFSRRIIVLEYKQTFKDEGNDVDLPEKLEAELDGIFLWAVEGLKRVLEAKKIQTPESVKQAKQRLRQKINPMLVFVEEKCRLHENAQVSPPELYSAYREWAEDALMKHPLGKHRFYDMVLNNFTITKKRDGKKEYYFGITLEDF